MIQTCIVGLEFLGVPIEEMDIHWDTSQEGDKCAYYSQVEDDPEHPYPRDKYCGNCIHYVVLKGDKC